MGSAGLEISGKLNLQMVILAAGIKQLAVLDIFVEAEFGFQFPDIGQAGFCFQVDYLGVAVGIENDDAQKSRAVGVVEGQAGAEKNIVIEHAQGVERPRPS